VRLGRCRAYHVLDGILDYCLSETRFNYRIYVPVYDLDEHEAYWLVFCTILRSEAQIRGWQLGRLGDPRAGW
jgi:hypothetical protein